MLYVFEHEPAEKWPAEIEFAADIAVRLDNALRGVRHESQIEAAVHALQRKYLARVLSAIQPARELRARRAEFGTLLFVAIEYEPRKISGHNVEHPTTLVRMRQRDILNV